MKSIFIDVMLLYVVVLPHCKMSLIGRALTHPISLIHRDKDYVTSLEDNAWPMRIHMGGGRRKKVHYSLFIICQI